MIHQAEIATEKYIDEEVTYNTKSCRTLES